MYVEQFTMDMQRYTSNTYVNKVGKRLLYPAIHGTIKLVETAVKLL